MKTAVRMIPANKDPNVMIKEIDRNMWHVAQVRRDINPNDPRRFRDSEIIQCYDTANFNRIFRPEIYYSGKAEKGKPIPNWKNACLIFEARIVHDPTLEVEKAKEPVKMPMAPDLEYHYSAVAGDDMAKTKEQPAPVAEIHDDMGTARKKRVANKTKK